MNNTSDSGKTEVIVKEGFFTLSIESGIYYCLCGMVFGHCSEIQQMYLCYNPGKICKSRVMIRSETDKHVLWSELEKLWIQEVMTNVSKDN